MKRISIFQHEEINELLRPYKKTAIMIAVIAMIQAALQAVILLLMKPMLENSIKSTELESIYIFGGLMLLMIVLHGTCAVLVSRKSAKITADIADKTRSELFRRVVMTDELDPSSDTSGMMIRLMTDIDNVQRTVTDFLRVWLYTFFLTFCLIAVSFTIDIKMGVTFLTATIIVYLIIIHAAKTEYGFRREIITRLENVIRSFRSYVKGARNRRYLACLESDQERFKTISGDYSKMCDDTRIRAYKRSSLARLLFMSSIVALLLLLFTITNVQTVDLASLTVFIQMAVLLETSLTLYPFFIESIPIASASLGKINQALRYKTAGKGSIPETSDSEYIIRSEDEKYPSIVRNQETAIVTLADAGAWDFVQKIMGTRNSPKGTLYLEETDISGIDHGYITKKIAYAGPKTLTFDGTVYDNIDVGRGIDKDIITEMCAALSIDKPLDYVIERSASNISSGETFRISIARALVSNADIYIFENCFILIDHVTKKRVIDHIRSVLKGKTVIFISPNTSVSESSDNIVIISDGRVLCNGTNAEISASNGLYNELRKARRCSL